MTSSSIAEAPQWLLDLCESPKARNDEIASQELDTPHAISRAEQFLQSREPATQGAGGDTHTFATAAACIDFGLSAGMAHALLLAHWNDRCAPPWEPDELQKKVDSAFKNRQNAVGSRDAQAEFGPYRKPNRLKPTPAGWYEPGEIGPRPWVIGTIAQRGEVTLLVAPGAAGKSTLGLVLAASVATGRPLLGYEVRDKTKVWVWNNEDREKELRRRWMAALLHHGVHRDEVHERVFLDSGDRHNLRVATRGAQNALIKSEDVEDVIDQIRQEGIGLIIIDPLVSTHMANENDNGEMDEVARLFGLIAQRGNCAVVVVHHTRKSPAASSEGHAGNIDSGRGASAVANVARIGLTLYGMSDKDARRYGVAAEHKHLYVRVDDPKANQSLTTGKPAWLRRVSVLIDEESVGTLEGAPLVEQAETVKEALADAVAELVADGPEPINVVLDELVNNPMFAGEEREVLRKRMKRMYENNPENIAWKITTRANGQASMVELDKPGQ